MASKQAALARPASQPRAMQHKKEAFWFYWFLSFFYDEGTKMSWTVDMRKEAIAAAEIGDRRLRVVDVGGGTGYSTEEIVKYVDAENVTLLDQSVHQLSRARQKLSLKGCTIIQGDAEALPFPTDYADRYISAGSINYWPEPQRGVNEAYRVLKPGGIACVIGPTHATFWLSRFFTNIWMNFPKEGEYVEWMKKAGFEDVKLRTICPSWYRGVRRHGLIMGCYVTGVKRGPGESPLKLGPKLEDVNEPMNPFSFAVNYITGLIAAGYFCLVPLYMWIKNKMVPEGEPI